nr:hypothetical protein [Tanacetum cinerariifolium]
MTFCKSLRVCINLLSWGKQLVSPFHKLKRKIEKRTKSEKTPNVPLENESPEPHIKQTFIEEAFAVKSKIKILMEKFKTPPDSSPITVIDTDDKPMWSSTRAIIPTPSFAIIQLSIPNNFHIKEEAVTLRTFPFSLTGEAKTWLNELNEGDVEFIEENEIKLIPTMPDLNPIMSNLLIVPPFYEDCTVHIPYTNAKTFANAVLPNHVGDKELKYVDGIRNGVLTKKEIKKDEMGMPKEPNKEWKLNEKVSLSMAPD